MTCIPLFYAAKRIGGLNLAAVAAWLWAIFPNAIILPYEALWDSSLAAFLTAVILWATLAVQECRRFVIWIAYGLLWGFAIMVTASLAALLPFLVYWTKKTKPRGGGGGGGDSLLRAMDGA